MRRRTIAAFVLALMCFLALGAAGCGGDDDGGDEAAPTTDTGEEGEATKGGTSGCETDAFVWTGQLRPDRRVPRHVPRPLHEPARPDAHGLPAHAPTPRATSSFRTSQRRSRRSRRTGSRTRSRSVTGVNFGPPLSRPVTSKDVEYAFRRIATPALVAQYGFYYLGVIEGLQEYSDARRPLQGPERREADRGHRDAGRQDDQSSRSTKPTGDFLYRHRDAGRRPDPAGSRRSASRRPASTAAS